MLFPVCRVEIIFEVPASFPSRKYMLSKPLIHQIHGYQMKTSLVRRISCRTNLRRREGIFLYELKLMADTMKQTDLAAGTFCTLTLYQKICLWRKEWHLGHLLPICILKSRGLSYIRLEQSWAVLWSWVNILNAIVSPSRKCLLIAFMASNKKIWYILRESPASRRIPGTRIGERYLLDR